MESPTVRKHLTFTRKRLCSVENSFRQNCGPEETKRPVGGPVDEDLESFCFSHGGQFPIRRLLIANNGNAAMKAIKSLRAWCLKTFSNEKAMQIVGMATTDDETANAEYINRCDYLAKVPDGPNHFNYANIHRIQEVAEQWDCDAIWPGWGHASEDYRLPRKLTESQSNVMWVGPPSDAMEALGCKIGSSILAQSVGVPVVPWSGSHVRAEKSKVDGKYRVHDDLKSLACISSAQDLLSKIQLGQLEFPLMIKAAAGGGGKGIRTVRALHEVETAYRQVIAEVKGSLVFAMHLLEFCRHLEVQTLGDNFGNVISLGCRDCSIQRRHQKIIEEGPPTIASDEILQQMEDCAILLCQAVGYVNAATVEFLYDLNKKSFFFLEVNARLQVEHVVTEMLTDVNLPAAQVQITMGIALHRIPDVAKAEGRLEKRHCVTARVTAEDAENGFQPTCGEVHELAFESAPNVWAYFSIGSASKMHQYADSQFGHIFATCQDREAARIVLILSLRSLVVRGEISTNVEALQMILESSDFINNKTHTTWLEQRMRFSSPPSERQVIGNSVLSAVVFAAVFKASKHFSEAEAAFASRLSQGQVPQPISTAFTTELVYKDTTKFALDCHQLTPNEIRVGMNGSYVDCQFNPILSSSNAEGQTSSSESTTKTRGGDTGWYLINGGLDGKHRRVCFRQDRRQDTLRVTVNSTTYNFTKEKDPTQIRAPFSGKLVRWIAPPFSVVQQGSPYAEIEIMKMYVQLTCDDPGIISHVLTEGAVFSAGDLLATLELPHGQVVIRPATHMGPFPTPVSGRKQKTASF